MIGGLVCDLCGTPLPGMDADERAECDDCMAMSRPWVQGRAAVLYKANARRIVLQLKHGDRQDLARPAGQWMARTARNLIRQDMLVAPVPLHRTRLLQRRYNQAALLAKEVARGLELEFCPDLLQRPKQRGSMEGMTHEERFEKMAGAIAPHPRQGKRIAGRSVLLVDDVMTSGATLTACANACLQGGAQDVRILTLARVAKDA